MATNPVRSTVGIVVGDVRPTHGRYAIVLLLFVLCVVNYADRSSLAITGPAFSKQVGLSGVALG